MYFLVNQEVFLVGYIKKCHHFNSIVCFITIYNFFYYNGIINEFDLLGTMLMFFYAFGNLFCNTFFYKYLFTITHHLNFAK